jgi:regulator of sirC expression with transglutaminase-like and TPR domain
LNRLREALTDCDKSLALRPDHEATFANRGFVYLRLGELTQA